MILLKKLFWILAFVISLCFVAIYFQRYMVAREWNKAYKLAWYKNYQAAEVICSNIFINLKWNESFLSFYGNVKLKNKKYSDAIELFEKSKFTNPDSYLLESLGIAYINYQLTINNKKARNEATNKAIYYWTLSGNILPWRLTPKYYLADLFYKTGKTNEAINYARIVVNTPMKKWTERGKEFKLKSQKMLNALGEKCDDPGLIVFDINDKSTWNEGKW